MLYEIMKSGSDGVGWFLWHLSGPHRCINAVCLFSHSNHLVFCLMAHNAFYYLDTDEIPGLFLLLKNHVFVARSEDTIFIFHM